VSRAKYGRAVSPAHFSKAVSTIVRGGTGVCGRNSEQLQCNIDTISLETEAVTCAHLYVRRVQEERDDLGGSREAAEAHCHQNAKLSTCEM
jgi:hypothetical protein